MKLEKLIYPLSSIIIIAGALLKIIFHWPHANTMILFGFIVTSFYQQWHVQQLKKRIKELETSR